ncbi:hypothetical protein GOP47_0014322 [Adiantum capillus-veneris]|uniref:FAE domain-containing protein n=1 Tax=Adiantum capillus-veneris TaxID=13818 RepID=A0A9D4ULA0_ADICA|nr:hypothetical protein GOP47_0014322 [Adiantum capillus-veneris]
MSALSVKQKCLAPWMSSCAGHVKPHQIGVIITNCSAFIPTPSMTNLIINRYKLHVVVKSFNDASMGWRFDGLLAFDLGSASCHPNKYSLILNIESLTRSNMRTRGPCWSPIAS